MKKLTLSIPDSKFHFFEELIQNFDFITIEENYDSKEAILKNIEEGFQELESVKNGKLKTTDARQFLDEIS
jgi:hypothetical protein